MHYYRLPRITTKYDKMRIYRGITREYFTIVYYRFIRGKYQDSGKYSGKNKSRSNEL